MQLRYVPLLIALTASTSLNADATIAERYLKDANVVGKARLKVMFWNVFDAQLYAENGQYSREEPFVLSLSYLRNIKGEHIVEKTIEEMALQAHRNYSKQELQSWTKSLDQIIEDVNAQTTITGVRDDQGHTQFYRNGEPLGSINDKRFTEGFFDIWLGESSSNTQLRRKLLNL